LSGESTISKKFHRKHLRQSSSKTILKIFGEPYLNDIYALGEIGERISLESPAPGLREHGVCTINGDYVQVTSKIAPVTEELILI